MKKLGTVAALITMIVMTTMFTACGTIVVRENGEGGKEPNPEVPSPTLPGYVDPGDGVGGNVSYDDPYYNPEYDYDYDGIPNGEDPDADGDGFFADENDCNDLDNGIYPGAFDDPNVDSYADSNCDGVDGDLSRALWVAPEGTDRNPGTIDLPFATIGRAVAVAVQDENNIKDVYVAAGVYGETVTLVKGAGLFGGYGPLLEDGSRARDINTYKSEAAGPGASFTVQSPLASDESTVEGMTIRGAADVAAVLIVNASPMFAHNNIIAANGINSSVALKVSVSNFAGVVGVSPYLYGNTITSGSAAAMGSQSVAVSVRANGRDARAYPVIAQNTISSGSAGMASIAVSVSDSNGGSSSVVISDNDIRAGSAAWGSIGIVMGFEVSGFMPASFEGANVSTNKIIAGTSDAFSCGIMMWGAQDTVTVANNFVSGGRSRQTTSGVSLTGGDYSISGNTINGGRSDWNARAIDLAFAVTARINNNILFAEGGVTSYGVFETVPQTSPETLVANLFDDSLTDMYLDMGRGNIRDIDEVNAIADINEVHSNITGGALFVDAANGDYHLTAASAAIDAGVDMEDLSIDIDWDARPQGGGIDIGADEFTVGVN